MTNVMFINGWGNALTSQSIARMRNRMIQEFGDQIYAPPPVDYNDASTMLRYLDKWRDVQILVPLSCGCTSINAIAAMRPNEVIPYVMYCSPSLPCGFGRTVVPKNVAKATQVTSNAFDVFNPGGYKIIKAAAGTDPKRIDVINSGARHGYTPDSPLAQARLIAEIKATLTGRINPNRKGK